MARTVKKADHIAKSNEILDATMMLINTKGYEHVAVQHILDTLRISRGAFYHYFDSKQALLEALIERSASEVQQALLPVVQNPRLSAIQKVQAYFDSSTRWKTSQKELILSAIQNWYSDENALIRLKLTAKSHTYMSRLLDPIIRQGIEEKLFTTSHPAEIAVIFVGMTLSLSDSLLELMLAPNPDQGTFQKAQAFLDAYFETIERMLGVPAGSFNVLDIAVFKEWFGAPNTDTNTAKE